LTTKIFRENHFFMVICPLIQNRYPDLRGWSTENFPSDDTIRSPMQRGGFR